MDKYILRTKRPRAEVEQSQNQEAIQVESLPNQNQTTANSPMEEDIPILNNVINVEQMIADPGLRPPLSSIGFNSMERERIRRAYLIKGPCQPILTKFPVTMFSGKPRKFNPSWYKEYHYWLEYSESKDAVFCLCCYLFNTELGDHRFNHESFVGEGFRNWKKKDRLNTHVGDHSSSHNKCLKACEDLLKQKQHVDIMIAGISTQAKLDYLASLANFIGASCKRKELLQVKQIEKVVEGISQGTLDSGQGMNQVVTLKRPGETRWSSHYNTIISVIALFSSTLEVLEEMKKLPSFSNHKGEISRLIEVMCEFEFVFLLFFMKKVLRITNDLSQALQRKDQDLPNAMGLVKVAKRRLQELREDGWDNLLVEVNSFCEKNEIDILNMDEPYVPRGRSKRNVHKVTNHHHFKTQILVVVVDFQLKEMNERFDNVNIELLTCISCLDPCHSFVAFDKQKLIQLAKFYPFEFDETHLLVLEDQLENYIQDMRSNEDFRDLKEVGEHGQRMVQKQKDIGFPLVYMLVKLALILPVATTTIERAFSAMNLIKGVLRNTMGDTWLNDCLVTYIERDIFENINNKAIMQRFQDMKNRRMLI